jgi:hypothetical protein
VDSLHDENDMWHGGEMSTWLNCTCRSWTFFRKLERHEFVDDFLAVWHDRKLRVFRFLLGEELVVDLDPLWFIVFDIRSW